MTRTNSEEQVGQLATTISTTRKGLTVVTYHDTKVVKFSRKKITLDTGGHQTATTRKRMNQTSSQHSLGYRVFQKDFGLFVTFKGLTKPFNGHKAVLVR